ncbi:hypothetical protein MTR_3g016320 [Medicago truncatula]|uniref:Uncharacterized protein n=1 Tax=Medicago truncatula TaxID=3880 RepID=G7IYU4_MEDTR|nr:hypothetical protein MTR_3g016320 [Medicago truncatula]
MQQNFQDLRSLGKELEEGGVLSESALSRKVFLFINDLLSHSLSFAALLLSFDCGTYEGRVTSDNDQNQGY